MMGSVLANRYEIVREVGRGGMGIVYLARDIVLERDVAVKLLADSQLTGEAEERFRREARVVARMDHPCIVPLHDFARHGDSVFLVMPFVQGSSLRQLLLERSPSIADCLEIGVSVAAALEYSHALGVTHRDVKPENIMVEREPSGALRVRVTDFGIAAADFEERVTKSGVILGTGLYLSPEQIGEADIDARSDLYSLGVVLYECLAGRPPFTGTGSSLYYRITFGSPKQVTLYRPDAPPELAEIIHRCLEKAPARRPPSARAVLDALHAVRASIEGLPPTGAQLPPVAIRRSDRPATSPFVGRTREIADLSERLATAASGEAQLAVIGGDAGMGKSRLLDAVEDLARERGIRVLHGRFLDRDRSFPFQGFCDVLQEHLLADASSGVEASDLADLAPGLAALFPALGEIPTMRTTSSAATEITSGSRQRFGDQAEVFELLARSLVRVGGGAPLLIVLEDLHASDVSVEALEYVVRRLSATPTLFVATYRSSEADRKHPIFELIEAFEGDRRFSWIRLAPLSIELQHELIAGMLAAPVDERLLDRVTASAEGNPFFIVELVTALVESGDARNEEGRWVLTIDPASSLELPQTIQQAVERRLKGLEQGARDVLAVAAVLGRRFEFDDLEALADGLEDVEDTVEWLVDVGLLKEESDAANDTLSFASAVVRDVVYNRMSRRRRRALHRTAATRLERRTGARGDRALPQLLHHFAAADVADKAVLYGLRLARRSIESFGYEEAIAAVTTALEFVTQLEPADAIAEAEARMLAGRAHRMAAQYDRALEELERAEAAYASGGHVAEVARVAAVAAETAWDARDVALAAKWVERGLEASVPGDAPSSSTRVRLLKLAATLASLRGEPAEAASLLAQSGRNTDSTVDLEPDAEATLLVGCVNSIVAEHPADARNRDEREALACVFETLTRVAADGSLAPLLCESVEVSGASNIIRFHLRRDVVAHDRSPVDAGAVKRALEASIRRSARRLPAGLSSLSGLAAFVDGRTDHVEGLVAVDGLVLEARFESDVPLAPILWSDPRTAIALPVTASGAEAFVGTGLFAVAERSTNRLLLQRYAGHWSGALSAVAAVDIGGGRTPEELATDVRGGGVDIARDLADESVDELLRDRRRRFRLVETTAQATYFLLLNSSRPWLARREERAAVVHALGVADTLRDTLTSASYPAVGLIPPHTIGHDPDRRTPSVSHEQDLSADARLLRLHVTDAFVALQPALADALIQRWRDAGHRVEIVGGADPFGDSDAVDAVLMGLEPQLADPSAVFGELLDAFDGRLLPFLAAEGLDEVIRATQRATGLESRTLACRAAETALLDSSVAVPLFHPLDRRLVAASATHVELHAQPPYIALPIVEKRASIEPTLLPVRAGGVLQVPIDSGYCPMELDPALARRALDIEVLSTAFETLTRVVDGAHAVPWLASDVVPERGGRRYRFRLRDALRFHDGRPVTARDVRYSFERLLREPQSSFRGQLEFISGAREMISGHADRLAGFHIESRLSFTVDLDYPIAFLPTLLSHGAVGIVPEGSTRFAGSWLDGTVGTGPFRVTRFVPGRRVELEANPAYWRREFPRADGLTFTFGTSSSQILEDFREGRASVVAGLSIEAEDELRRSREFAAGCREAPLLQTVLIAFNTRSGPFADPILRQHVARAVAADAIVERAAGRRAVVAEGVIPPGLGGYEPIRRTTGERFRPANLARPVRVGCLMRPLFVDGALAGFREALFAQLAQAGIDAEILERDADEFEQTRASGGADMFLLAWTADYPDADSFAYGLLQSEKGWLGRFCGTPEVDKLVERARSSADPELRHDLYRQVELAVARGTLVLPLFHERAARFARPEVRGLEVSFAPPFVAYEKLWIER